MIGERRERRKGEESSLLSFSHMSLPLSSMDSFTLVASMKRSVIETSQPFSSLSKTALGRRRERGT